MMSTITGCLDGLGERIRRYLLRIIRYFRQAILIFNDDMGNARFLTQSCFDTSSTARAIQPINAKKIRWF